MSREVESPFIEEHEYQAGTIEEVIGRLHPDIPVESRNWAADIGIRLAQVDPSPDGEVIWRGSGGRRIAYEGVTGNITPPGFRTTQTVWRELVDTGLADFPEAHIIATSQPDIDWALDEAVPLEKIGEVMNDASLPYGVEKSVQTHTYGGISLVIARHNDLEVGVHHLPNGSAMERDHRLAIQLPIADAFCVARIDQNGVVTVDDASQDIVASGLTGFGGNNPSLTQAILGAQRALVGRRVYERDIFPIRDPIRRIQGTPIENLIGDPDYWDGAREKSTHDSIDGRQTEMTLGFLRLLTVDPGSFSLNRGLFNQTGLGRRLPPEFQIEFNVQEYKKQFNSVSLPARKSGVALLANQLGISIREVAEGLRVSWFKGEE